MGNEIIITEREGRERQIVLRGRSLPFQGVDFPTRLRVDINYPTGNPVATSQVTGPTWMPTTMEGKWSDLYLFEDNNAPTLLNFPTLQSQVEIPEQGSDAIQRSLYASGGVGPGQRARTAFAVKTAMQTLARSGMLLRMEWGPEVRFGYMEEFTPTYDRIEDIAWEIQWVWTGDKEFQPIPKKQRKDLPSTIKNLLKQLQRVLSSFRLEVFQAEIWTRRLRTPIVRLGQLGEDLLGTLKRLVNFSLIPADLFGTMKSSFKGVQFAANEILDIFKDISLTVETSKTGDPSDVHFDNAIQSAIRKLLVNLAAQGRLSQDIVDEFDAPTIRRVFRSSAGITLRDISLQEFGTVNNWRAIQDFNGFSSSVVPVGTLVRVPEL